MKKLLLFIFLIFISLNNLNSTVIHISGKKFQNFPKTRPKVRSHLEKPLKNLKAAPGVKKLDTIGLKKIAVIVVDFPDQRFSYGWHNQANQIFSQFVRYYDEVSYGKLKLEYVFFYDGGSSKMLTGEELPYRLPKNMSFYGQDTEKTLSQLIKDALLSTNNQVNASSYDYVMVFHAGYGNESTNRPEDIWSVYIDWDTPVNGFTDGTIVPEKEYAASPLGVVCHEFGHQLGLPDLYYDQESVVGCWCLMDNGVWLGTPPGSKPAHLSAWAKYFLGWLDVQVTSYTWKNVFLENIVASSSAIKVNILTADNPDKEYFLLEYRTKTGFNEGLPGSGLLIWRIDDTIASSPVRLRNNDINSGMPHLAVDLIAADKSRTGKDKNDAGDPFPGSSNVSNFIPQQYNITAYNGQPININITQIYPLDINYINFNIITLSGLLARITTLDKTPLNNVKVHVYNQNYSTISFSSNGFCMIELSTGIWNLGCSLDEYIEYKDIFEVQPDKLTLKDVILRYDPKLVLKKSSFVVGNNYLDYNKLPKISFRYYISSPSEVQISVFNLSGNLVRTIRKYHSLEGYYEELWNLENENLPSGLYFVHFKSKDTAVVDKFIIKK